MLTKENFNESHIRMLQKQSKKDPALLERAVFAFKQCEEQVRIGKNSIEKRHFKFTYQSPIIGKDIYIFFGYFIC